MLHGDTSIVKHKLTKRNCSCDHDKTICFLNNSNFPRFEVALSKCRMLWRISNLVPQLSRHVMRSNDNILHSTLKSLDGSPFFYLLTIMSRRSSLTIFKKKNSVDDDDTVILKDSISVQGIPQESPPFVNTCQTNSFLTALRFSFFYEDNFIKNFKHWRLQLMTTILHVQLMMTILHFLLIIGKLCDLIMLDFRSK